MKKIALDILRVLCRKAQGHSSRIDFEKGAVVEMKIKQQYPPEFGNQNWRVFDLKGGDAMK